ncbi:MAG: hypothetical protein ACREIA_05890 [Opitutaceae bacterium]
MRLKPDFRIGILRAFVSARATSCLFLAATVSVFVPESRSQEQPEQPELPEEPVLIQETPDEPSVQESSAPTPEPRWIDRAREGVHRLVWRSAMSVDRLAGSKYDEEEYQAASGSLAMAMLWDEFDGWDPKVRFRVDVPLPQLNERYRFFVGRLNPDEYVSEELDSSGAFPRRGRLEEDETLAGIVYAQAPRLGGRFGASAGTRVSPFDPYVKGKYQYERMLFVDTRLRIRETLFWRESEGFGLTSRIDIEKDFGPRWYMLWTGSATISEESEGVRSYGALTITHVPKERHSISTRFLIEGETDADVTVRDVGIQVAYRRNISRDWLVLEVRTDLMWPKDYAWQPRKPSWGFGVGFEMYFGGGEVSASPVTF